METRENMTFDFATNIADRSGGITYQTRAGVVAVNQQTSSFTQIIQDFSSHTRIAVSYPPCGDSCSITVKVRLVTLPLDHQLIFHNLGIRPSSELLPAEPDIN